MEKCMEVVKKQTETFVDLQQKNKEILTKITDLVSQNFQSRQPVAQQQGLYDNNMLRNINAYNMSRSQINSNSNLNNLNNINNMVNYRNAAYMQIANRNLMIHQQNNLLANSKNLNNPNIAASNLSNNISSQIPVFLSIKIEYY